MAGRVSCSVISPSAPCPTGRRSTAAGGRRLQQQRADGVHHRLARAAQAGEQHVAVEALAIGDDAAQRFLQLGIGMVAGAGDQLVAAHQVQARIAAVRPVGRVALQHAGDDRRARRVDQPLLWHSAAAAGGRRSWRPAGSAAGSFSVGLASRWNSAARVCSASCEATSPSGWPPMPSASANRPGLPRVAIAHAVFVLLAAAFAADLEDVESHAFRPDFRFSSCSFRRSLKLSLV
jgi:hypothetical protein